MGSRRGRRMGSKGRVEKEKENGWGGRGKRKKMDVSRE